MGVFPEIILFINRALLQVSLAFGGTSSDLVVLVCEDSVYQRYHFEISSM